MKIAFVNSEWLPVPPVKGGAVEEWIERIAQKLESYKVYIFGIYDKALPRYEIKTHISYFRFKPGLISKILLCTYKLPFKNFRSPLFYFPYSLWSAFKLKRIKPDIIHIHNRPQFVWIIKLLNPDARIILHIHQVSAMYEKNIWIKRFFRKVDLFLGCSQFIANELKKRYPQIQNKTRFIYNGTDIERFKPVRFQDKAREDLREQFGINGQKVIMYSGRLAENKGVDILIEAFKKIVKYRDKNLKLLICGGRTYSDNSTSPYIEKLRNLSSEIKDNVIFTGYITHTEIHKYYLLSDLVIIPSLVEEGFCVIAIESMASGIPVIAPARGGLLEIITNKKDGILVPRITKEILVESIEGFLNQADSFAYYAVNGRQTVENNFSWDKISESVKITYQDIIKNA